MNTYRVHLLIGERKRRYDVDASSPGAAINRALARITSHRTSDVDVSCRLFATNIDRHYGDPKVREA